ncbi:long-chain fatty acid--CoA ligase [Halobacteriales archaeon QS_3_64_16]|nr:MAG: long-chain fatty acid--CoA ligase [Halobacteriales archaeon QS_3_64_16]
MLHWPAATIYEALSGIAAARPNADALRFEGERITYGELLAESRALASGLAELGVGPGDTIAVWLANRPEWITTQLASSYLGAAVVAVNTRYRTHELEYLLRDAECSALVTERSFLDTDFLATLAEVVPEIRKGGPTEFVPESIPSLDAVVALESTGEFPAVRAYEDVIAGGETTTDENARGPEPATDPTAPACIFYTSGTTSDPKGCPQTNRSLLNHSHQVGVHLGVERGDVALGVLPFPGVWGHNALLSALAHGIPLVIRTHFEAGKTLRLIEERAVTYYSALATMHRRLIDHADFTPERVASLERGAVGFLSMGYDEAVFDRIEAALGFPLVQPYGLSEANSQVFVGDPEDPIERRKRVGGPLIHPEEESAKIVDPETGAEQPPGEEGELCLRGYNVVEKYFGKPEATTEAFEDAPASDTSGSVGERSSSEKWFHTGDLVVQDEAGYLYFRSRLDDALRVRGFLLAPRDIERVLDDHPAVKGSQVVGAPHPRHGQVPVAFVEAADGSPVDEGILEDFLAGRIADYKLPAAFEFVDAFPRAEGPHGAKVRKDELRERVADRFREE